MFGGFGNMIRKASMPDVAAIHEFGLTIPEIRVNEDEFMSLQELQDAIQEPSGVFYIAGEDYVTGFAYARIDDIDRGPGSQACFVYLAVAPSERKMGLGDRLCRTVLDDLTRRGIHNVYTWAHPTSGVIGFMERHGFNKGHSCVWMSKELTCPE